MLRDSEETCLFKVKFWSIMTRGILLVSKNEMGLPAKWRDRREYADFRGCQSEQNSDLLQKSKIQQNKGYYAIQGHSRLSVSIPIERPYATSY